MIARDKWHAFVTDPARAGRHLSNLGTSVGHSATTPVDPSVLEDFLQRLSNSEASVELIASIVDLTSREYFEFCTRHLPPLLDSLANEKVGELAVVGPMLRGNTRWDLTAIGRTSGRVLPTQFVTRLPQRSFVLPENALVRWLVDDLTRTVKFVENSIGSKALLPQLSIIREGCEEAMRHQWFREVPPPRWLDASMRLAAQRQRLPAYRIASGLAARRLRYSSKDHTSRWRHILELLAVSWLAPVSDDDLFELFSLVMVLDLLENELGLGSPTQYGLAAPGRDHIALFDTAAGSVRVYFDQSPVSVLGCRSYQLEILDAHDGARGVGRRPDLMLVHDGPSSRHVMFVEVKRTADGSYISDSVYKALGYISDFRDLWAVGSTNPKIAVLFPEGIAPRDQSAIGGQEVVLSSAFDRTSLASALRLGLSL